MVRKMTVRKNLVFTPGDWERVRELRELLDTASDTQAIRESLKIALDVVRAIKGGSIVRIRNKEEQYKYRLPGV